MKNNIDHLRRYKISFIIATVDRDKQLQRCLIAVEKAYEYAKGIAIEILVVFQDRTENKTITTNYPDLCTFYYLQQRGLSLARNFGIKKSTGDYLVFIDDDTLIQEDFLTALIKNISITGAAAFCCRDTDPLKKRLYCGRFLQNKPKVLNYWEFVYFLGYAHVVKKTVMDVIGGYDERFGVGAKYGGAEESDIFFRVKQLGEKVVYLSELVVYHPLGDITPEIKRFNYSYAIAAMLIKQIVLDKKHLFIYLFIILEIIFKSLVRTLQAMFFLQSMKTKNLLFRPKAALTGTLKGIGDYIKQDF